MGEEVISWVWSRREGGEVYRSMSLAEVGIEFGEPQTSRRVVHAQQLSLHIYGNNINSSPPSTVIANLKPVPSDYPSLQKFSQLTPRNWRTFTNLQDGKAHSTDNS